MKTESKNRLPPEAYKLLAGLSIDVLEKIIADFWTNPDFNLKNWKHVVLTILPKKAVSPTSTIGVVLPFLLYAQMK
jgi:hypothetical protein